MKTTKIKSAHTTLAEAVATSGYDMSYNEAEAKRVIRDTDTVPPRWAHEMTGTIKAYVTDLVEYNNPVILYTTKNTEGLVFLHRFSPFCSVMSDSRMVMSIIDEALGTIHTTAISYPKTPQGRKDAAELCSVPKENIVAFS